MDMHVQRFVKVRRQPKLHRPRAHIAHRRPRAFLHHVAQLPRQQKAARSGHHRRFHRERLAAVGRVRQAARQADLGLFLRRAAPETRRPQHRLQIARLHGQRLVRLLARLQPPQRRLAQHLGNGAFELAHARLARIPSDDGPQRPVRQAHLPAPEAVFRKLLGHQMAPGNAQLLLLRVAGEADELHTVQQRRGNLLGIVGRGQKQHLGQVKGELQVMVAERAVLFGVEHLQHGRGRIAAKVMAHLVDFVEEEHRVHRAGLFHAIQNPAGNGPHIGAAMPADFRLVAHAAQRHLHEPAAQRPRHRPRHGSLPHAGRAHQAQNRPAQAALQAADGQVFHNALLDLVQAVMVLVEHAARAPRVQPVLGAFPPGQVQNPFDIAAADPDFRRAGRHARQPAQLALDLLARLVVERGVGQALAQVFHVIGVPVAQLGLNGPNLFPQEIILLVLFNLRAHALLHLPLDGRQLRLAREDAAQRLQPFAHVAQPQDMLAVVHVGQHVGGDDVRQLGRLLDAQYRGDRLSGHAAAALGIFFKKALRGAHQRGQLLFPGARRIAHRRHVGQQAGLLLNHAHQPAALHAFHQHADVVARELEHLLDARDGPDLVQVLSVRVFLPGVMLRDQKNALVLHKGLFQRRKRALSSHIEVQYHMGKHHQPAQRKHGQAFGCAFSGQSCFLLWCVLIIQASGLLRKGRTRAFRRRPRRSAGLFLRAQRRQRSGGGHARPRRFRLPGRPHRRQRLLQRLHRHHLDAGTCKALHPVRPGHQHARQPGAPCRFNLGRHAAHRADFAGHAYLAGQRGRAVHRPAGQGRTRRRGHRHAGRRAVHRRAARKIDMKVLSVQRIAQAAQQRRHVFGRGAGHALAPQAVAVRPHFLFLDNARHQHAALPAHGDGLDVHDRALLRAVYRQPVHPSHRRGAQGAGRGPRGIAPAVEHPLDIRPPDGRPSFQLSRPGGHLHDVDRVASARRVLPDERRLLPRHAKAGAARGARGNVRDLLRFQGAEVHLHAAGTQRGRQRFGASGGGPHQPEIRRQPMAEDLVNVARHGPVFGVIVGRLKAYAPVLQHLEKLVHLDRVQLPNLVQKQHAAMGPRNRAGLGLRHAVDAERARALVDGVVHAAQQRVGNGALVKAHAGRVHLDERRVLGKGRTGRVLGVFQDQPGRAGLADAGRAVDDDMLRIGSAQNRLERADSLRLAHDIFKARRPYALGKRLGQAHRAQLQELVHFPASPPARSGLRLFFLAQLSEKIYAHHQRRQQLNRRKQCRHPIPPYALAIGWNSTGALMLSKAGKGGPCKTKTPPVQWQRSIKKYCENTNLCQVNGKYETSM